MKLTKNKKIILITIFFLAIGVLLFNSNTVFAAINGEYANTNPVSDEGLEDAFSQSSLLSLLAKLIYAVGHFLEWILGTIFKLLTGTSDFPWADKIVFNAVALLDVNFINPDSRSFVGQSQIQDVLKDLYATIFTLAASFFGIIVLITAIKLVISTIASDKAKYKQAIVDWVTGFVLLFCIHFGISFIFYLNEELVKVASKIVIEQLEEKNVQAQVQASKNAAELINSMGNAQYNGTYKGKSNVLIKTILQENISTLEAYINLDSADKSKGLQEFLMKGDVLFWDKAIDDDEQKQRLATIIAWAAEENVSVQQLTDYKKNNIYIVRLKSKKYAQAVTWVDLETIFKDQFEAIHEIHKTTGQEREYRSELTDNLVYRIKDDNREFVSSGEISNKVNDKTSSFWASGGAHQMSNGYFTNPVRQKDNIRWNVIFDELIALKGTSNTSSGKFVTGSGERVTLISDLASYFKLNASEKEFRSTNITGLKDSGNIKIQNMIMYAVLVAQSLILFISYIKRLFYVILLAMMAPLVVVIDFFNKFGK